jgi:TonB family protein
LPSIPPKLKRRLPATVKLIFVVDERGRVVNPKVRSSTDPDFNDLALRAVQGWNYEPGKSGGQAVRFPIAQSITFEAG